MSVRVTVGSCAFDTSDRETLSVLETLSLQCKPACITHEHAHALCGFFWAMRLWLEREAVRACADCGDRVEWVFHPGCG